MKSYKTARSVTDVPIPRGFPGSGSRKARGRRDDDIDDEDDAIEPRPDDLERAERADEEPAPESGRIVHALRDVSLEIQRGARLAVLGPAGSGKSTLLKVIARITPPTEGRVTVRGRVSPPLDLAASFLNPNTTGRQNAVTVARLFGVPKRLVLAQLDDIFELAGISEKLDHRVGTYSNRQYRRLAISVALHLQPSILLIDDRLVGADDEFAQRVHEWLLAASAKGDLTILFAAADAEIVGAICDEAIWLDEGHLVKRDSLEQVDAPVPKEAPAQDRPAAQDAPPSEDTPPLEDTPADGRRPPASVPGLGGLDLVDTEQRELARALVAEGRTYAQLAAERGVTVDRVRADAQRMLVEVAPDGGRLEPELREAIGDFMLGQTHPDPAELQRLAASPGARHWPVVIAHFLEHLAPEGLPAFPREPGPGGYQNYDGVIPRPRPDATLLAEYLAIALGPDRAREAVAAATDKAIWKGVPDFTWSDVCKAAGYDRAEAKAVTRRLEAARKEAGLPALSAALEAEDISIATATLRAADGLPADSLRRSEQVTVETVVEVTDERDMIRVELVFQARGLNPVRFRQPQGFCAPMIGRYRFIARFPVLLLDPAEYRASVVVDVTRNGRASQVELLDAFGFEVLDVGDELDGLQEVDPAADVRWHVSG